MKIPPILAASLLLVACDAQPRATVLFDPASRSIMMWPDESWTIEDATTPTGTRLHVIPDDNFEVVESADKFRQLFLDLSLLDGFGTTASAFFRASDALLPETVEGGVFLVDLDSDPPALVAFEHNLVVEDEITPSTTVVISPLRPLRALTRYGFAVTRDVRTVDKGALGPTPQMAQRIAKGGPLVDALKALGKIKGQGDLAAMTHFTTQHVIEDSAKIAADIRARPYAYHALGPCTLGEGGAYRICEGTFNAFDYRDAMHHLDDDALSAHAPYTLPVTVYLPTTAAAPYPTLLYGHGLGGDRHQAQRLAEISAPEGFATIAIDAVMHGNHPDQPATAGSLFTITEFFGFSISGPTTLDSRRLRDNFRQSAYDKLQLLEMIRPGVDVDGDALPDVAIDRVMYLGVSLGGIMSAEFLAFAPEIRLAVPIVPGARVSNIVADGDQFRAVITLFRAQASDGDVARFFPLLQTAIDRGDPGSFATHIVSDRIAGFDAQRPSVLMQMVINDDTVPNTTNRFFARSLGVPHVGDELQPIGTIPHVQALPLSANLGAAQTGGVFQYDVVFDGEGPKTEEASHGNVAANPIAILQTLHFAKTFLAGQPPEIIDPYRALRVKP